MGKLKNPFTVKGHFPAAWLYYVISECPTGFRPVCMYIIFHTGALSDTSIFFCRRQCLFHLENTGGTISVKQFCVWNLYVDVITFTFRLDRLPHPCCLVCLSILALGNWPGREDQQNSLNLMDMSWLYRTSRSQSVYEWNQITIDLDTFGRV